VAEKGKMDVFVRFWDSVVSQVCTRYYNSSFLGCATATDLQNSLTEATRGLDFGKILQIAMDGPNVNKKLCKDLTAEQKIFSRNYGREPTFRILYSNRYFNTKKMKKNPKNSKNENNKK